MLLRAPSQGKERYIAMWRSMTPLTPDLFQSYWEKVEPHIPMIDVDRAELDEWQVVGSWRCEGTRLFGWRELPAHL